MENKVNEKYRKDYKIYVSQGKNYLTFMQYEFLKESRKRMWQTQYCKVYYQEFFNASRTNPVCLTNPKQISSKKKKLH